VVLRDQRDVGRAKLVLEPTVVDHPRHLHTIGTDFRASIAGGHPSSGDHELCVELALRLEGSHQRGQAL